MFKFIAILLFFSSSSSIGIYHASRLNRRQTLLIQYRDLMHRLETEIGYFKAPLPQLFAKLQNNTNESIDLFLRQCLFQINTTNKSISEIWETATKDTYENEPLNSSDLAIMCKCGHFLGQSDYQSQRGYFALLQGELNGQIDEAAANCKTKGILYTKAGISIGAVLAIALI